MKKVIALVVSAVMCLCAIPTQSTTMRANADETLTFRDFTYMLNNRGNITITGYTGNEPNIIVPAKIDNLPVTTILADAFYRSHVYGVYIPESVVSIGEDIMWNVNGDDSVIFGEEGSYAAEYAESNSYHFYSTNQLTGTFGDDIHWNYDISSGHLTVSGSGAMPVYTGYSPYTLECYKAEDNIPWYYLRHAVRSASMEGTVTSIGEAAFYECDQMTEFTMSDYVTTISGYAFSECKKLETIKFSESLASIAPYVFIRNYKLDNISFPASLTNISFTTFNGCDSLSSVEFDSENPAYCSVDGVVFSKDMTSLCFYPDAKSDISYAVPEGVTTIDSYAMEGASNLEMLSLPSTLTTIYTEALALMGVKRFVIPENVSYLGENCLYSRTAEAIIFTGNAPKHSNSLFYTSGSAVTDVYCHFSDTSWYTFMDNYQTNINWIDLDQYPESGIELSSDAVSVKERESVTLTARFSPIVSNTLNWNSSNNAIAIVSDGTVTGISPGKCTITVSDESGEYSAQCTVTVTRSDTPVSDKEAVIALSGSVSANESKNNYSVYYATVKSYLNETDSGQLERIEYIGDSLLVECYSKNGTVPISSKKLTPEFSIFGGCYCGSTNNYVVSGKANSGNGTGEILCVEKYSKEWKKLDSVIVSSSDTKIPFDASSCRIAEKDNYLFIHTGQELQIGHQSNMTFKIDTDKMELLESMTFISTFSTLTNFQQEGFVSHSFNQFVKEDNGYIYRVDHGEGAMHGIGISKCSADGSIKEVSTLISYPFHSGSTNATGASVGGFELSTNNIIIAANSIDQSLDSYPYGQRNILLSIATKNLKNPKTVWLTNYSENSGVTVRTPQIIKYGSELFLIMWEETSSNTKVTKAVSVDGNGNTLSNICTLNYPLSDCQPNYMSDGYIRWYVSNGTETTLYAIDPFRLSDYAMNIIGDVNADGEFNVSDVVLLQKWLLAVPNTHLPNWKAGNFCEDDRLDVFDLCLMKRLLIYG